jgi:hypothetical protein
VNKTFVPNLAESFRKIAKDEADILVSVDQIKTVINHDLLELNA